MHTFPTRILLPVQQVNYPRGQAVKQGAAFQSLGRHLCVVSRPMPPLAHLTRCTNNSSNSQQLASCFKTSNNASYMPLYGFGAFANEFTHEHSLALYSQKECDLDRLLSLLVLDIHCVKPSHRGLPRWAIFAAARLCHGKT